MRIFYVIKVPSQELKISNSERPRLISRSRDISPTYRVSLMTCLASITQIVGERLKRGCAARSGVALRMAARLAIPMRQCLLLFSRSQTWLRTAYETPSADLELQSHCLRRSCYICVCNVTNNMLH